MPSEAQGEAGRPQAPVTLTGSHPPPRAAPGELPGFNRCFFFFPTPIVPEKNLVRIFLRVSDFSTLQKLFLYLRDRGGGRVPSTDRAQGIVASGWRGSGPACPPSRPACCAPVAQTPRGLV